MYAWRKMSDAERECVLRIRVARGGSWRRPPVWDLGEARYLITAACFEHQPIIGHSNQRMDAFEAALLAALDGFGAEVFAHAVLPNHYHVLLRCDRIGELRRELGRMHGRLSLNWNREEGCAGRKVFHGSTETRQKSERHFCASLNYVHHNPVRHGHVSRWQDWPWSSATEYLASVGIEEALRHWREYPIEKYGDGWD